jgi:hypothetical protein
MSGLSGLFGRSGQQPERPVPRWTDDAEVPAIQGGDLEVSEPLGILSGLRAVASSSTHER